MPEAERPRERMLTEGPDALSNAELISILIGTGGKEESAMALASKVLSLGAGGISFIATATPSELMQVPGIGQAKACSIAAASALGRRMAQGAGRYKPKFSCPEDVAHLLMEDMRRLPAEQMRVVMLSSRGEMMCEQTVSSGDVKGASAGAREIFHAAIKQGASKIVLVHNHPSGNPEPSEADIRTTQGLVKAGQILGIAVTDHIIIGDGTFVSMKRRKLM